MTSMRKRKARICRALPSPSTRSALKDRFWDEIQPVGREFGSPDFERLMDEDFRNGVGVFDPALKDKFLSGVDVPEDMIIQHRKPL